jgi:DNA-binding NtrC family response regulator
MADPITHPANILIVEDDPSHRELAEEILAAEGYAVTAAADGLAALDYLSAHACDLVLSDVRMPDLDGMGLLQALERQGPHPPVIFMSAYAGLDHTVDAVKAGAYGYIVKPCTPKRLLHLVSRALGEARLRQENDLLRRELHAQWRCEDLIGRSPAMQSVFRMVGVAAEADGTVLILGESGTGKELVARAIHARSARRGAPFVALNCAGMPESLLESELFGHVRGAFTGAMRDKAGLFQAANGGTLFLDEIGDAPPSMQAKLLRALETREVRPVGSTRAERVDARVIAATNMDLAEAIQAGRFRKDLYYRLNVIAIELPRLADRAEDIPLLADHFLARANARQRRSVVGIAPEALRRLLNHPWPGNVRELENTIERAVILAAGGRLAVGPLLGPAPTPAAAETVLTDAELRRRERANLLAALRLAGGRVYGPGGAAALLGVPPTTFASRLRRLEACDRSTSDHEIA